jgi:hypothetical protein
VTSHGNCSARFDFLLGRGNKRPESGSGPTFQFRDVNYDDLNLTGNNVPDSCLFFLDPVSTEAR